VSLEFKLESLGAPNYRHSGDASADRQPPPSSAVFPRPMSRLLPAATRQPSSMTSGIGPTTETPTSKMKQLKRKADLPSADQRKKQRIDTTSVAESVVASVLEGAQKLEKFRTHLEAKVVLENLKHLNCKAQSLEDVEVAYRVDSKKASCRSWWSSLTSAYASEALFGLLGQHKVKEGRPAANCTQSRTDRELRAKCRLERHRERLYARFSSNSLTVCGSRTKFGSRPSMSWLVFLVGYSTERAHHAS